MKKALSIILAALMLSASFALTACSGGNGDETASETTGETTLKAKSTKLCTVTGGSDGARGTPVQVDVYIWLEGCDEDCTSNLCDQTLQKLAISFAGMVQ